MIESAAKGAVLLTIALVASFAMQRRSAAARHLLWTVSVTALLALPLVTLAAPAWNVLPSFVSAVEPVADVSFTTTPANEAPALRHDAVVSAASSRAEPSTNATPAVLEAPPPTSGTALTRTQVLLLLWLMGVLLVAATVAFGFVRVRLLERAARRIDAGALIEEVDRVAREMGAGRVVVLEGDDFAMPMTWGVLEPKLLLPRGAHQWAPAKLRAVLRHELAHVRRRDSFWQLVGETACALHWFNPLAWHAARRLRVEREHACDDEVLRAGSRASEYANELLEIARSLRSRRATSFAAIAMAQPRQLEGRLLAVLDETRERARLGRKWPAWFTAVAIVVPISALEPEIRMAEPAAVAPPAKEWVKPAPKTATIELAPVVAAWSPSPSPSLAGAPALTGNQDCFANGSKNLSINSNSDDDFQRIKWETSRCKGTIEIRGKVRMAGDLSGIESITPGGEFRVFENNGRDKRELVVTSAGGRLVYEYEIDGDRKAWNGEGRAWLSSVLSYLVRGTGFAADERIDYLLKERGVAGVLGEIEAMSSDYVQGLYLKKLLGKTTLNATALEPVIATAARELQSDYELAGFLITVADKYEFNEPVRRAFIQATTTLKSDYEHRRALSAVLKKGGLSSENVSAVLLSSQAIGSDYEKAELLLSIASKYKLDPNTRAAYLASARNLRSDYEKGRVFKELIRQAALTGDETAQVLDALSSMKSDYERSEVLRLVSSASLTSPQLQQSYLQIVTQMKSDYEVRRALGAMLARGPLSAPGVDLVLAAAARLSSDYERAELLIALMRANTLNADQRNRLIKLTETFRSDHDRGRVSSLLLKQLSNSN